MVAQPLPARLPSLVDRTGRWSINDSTPLLSDAAALRYKCSNHLSSLSPSPPPSRAPPLWHLYLPRRDINLRAQKKTRRGEKAKLERARFVRKLSRAKVAFLTEAGRLKVREYLERASSLSGFWVGVLEWGKKRDL